MCSAPAWQCCLRGTLEVPRVLWRDVETCCMVESAAAAHLADRRAGCRPAAVGVGPGHLQAPQGDRGAQPTRLACSAPAYQQQTPPLFGRMQRSRLDTKSALRWQWLPNIICRGYRVAGASLRANNSDQPTALRSSASSSSSPSVAVLQVQVLPHVPCSDRAEVTCQCCASCTLPKESRLHRGVQE